MSNVIQLHQPHNNEMAFMACPGCGSDNAGFIPLVIVRSPPMIAGLICCECQHHLDIVSGAICSHAEGL